LIKFNEYELYQQPLCDIYICSIYDNPDNIMPKISDKGKIPSLIYERIYEPDMPVLIIIIHDKSDEKKMTLEEKNKYINGFKNLYKSHYLLYWELNDIKNNNENDLDGQNISILLKNIIIIMIKKCNLKKMKKIISKVNILVYIQEKDFIKHLSIFL